jgi:hypothetical protein
MAAFPYINIPADAQLPLTGEENLLVAQDGVLRKTSAQSIADLAGGDVSIEVAGELFVSTNGSDTTGTGALSAPLASIDAALVAASAEYPTTSYVRINVGPGDFTTPLSITRARTSIVGANVSADDRTTRLGPVTVDCASATQKFQDTVALSGLFIQSTTAQPALKITGTGLFSVDVVNAYITTTVAGQNAVLCDASNAGKPAVYLRSCVVTKQVSASVDVIRFARGDARLDSTRVYASVSGTGNGVSFENNAVGLIDRALIDVSTTGSALRVNLALSTASFPVSVSNSALTANASSSACAYLANTLGPAALIWQCILTKPLSGAGEYAITGLSNGSTLTLLSGNLAFPVNSTINTVTRVGMTIV